MAERNRKKKEEKMAKLKEIEFIKTQEKLEEKRVQKENELQDE